MAGKTFVITGKLNRGSRKEVQDKIELNSGIAGSSVNKKTDYLVNNDVTSTSGKNKKAMDLDIPSWRNGPRTTYQTWGFDDYPAPNPVPADVYNNSGEPVATITGSFPTTRWLATHLDRTGIWTTEDWIELYIPNTDITTGPRAMAIPSGFNIHLKNRRKYRKYRFTGLMIRITVTRNFH